MVTGASSGIGRAFAEWLARAGLNVALAARSGDTLEQLAAELRGHGVETIVIAADLATREGQDAVLRATSTRDVGLLVAAAGFGTSGPFIGSDLEQERKMLAVNCEATLVHAHAFGRRFAQQGRGGIVVFSSLLGWQGTPQSAHYAATKAWVQALAEGLHAELAPLGVDVVTSAPGPVKSGFAAAADMRMSVAMPAASVVRPTLAALGHRTTVVPGTLSKLLTLSLAPLPRFLRSRIVGKIMANMTSHQRTDASARSSAS